MDEQRQLRETLKDRETAPILLGMRYALDGRYNDGLAHDIEVKFHWAWQLPSEVIILYRVLVQSLS